MSALDRIVEELKLKNKTQTDLCNYLGINRQHFSHWKSDRSVSYFKYLPQIAEFLDVTVDYLLGRTDLKKKPKYYDLPENERTLIFKFRLLPPKERARVLNEIDALRQQMEEKLAKQQAEEDKND